MPGKLSPPIQQTVPAEASPANEGAPRRLTIREVAPPACFVLALWGIAIWHFGSEWNLNAQYRYGWAVPLLSAYLFSLRISTRPPRGRFLSASVVGFAFLFLGLIVAAALPLREANPDWRLLGWLFAAVAISASFLLLARLGGRPWVRHFTFPILFFLTAVPWPREEETVVMNRLMRGNATLAAEGLRWLGYEAATRGNVIELPSGTVTVDGACSGVRSLQGFIMMTLFLSEMLQLATPRRVLLLASGILWALIANLLRTTCLGWIAARQGIPAIDRWHDPIGYTVLGVGFLFILGLAALVRPRPAASSPPAAPTPETDLFAPLRALTPTSLASLSLLIIGLLATQGWFYWHERQATRLPAWSVRFPTELPSYRSEKISEPVQGELRFDEGHSGAWADDAGRRWHAFYLRWAPGRMWEQYVLVHDPRICLQAAGMQFVEALPAVAFERESLHLQWDAYRFRDPTGDVFVFNCVSSDLLRPTGTIHSIPLSRFARWNTVMSGLRHRGQRRLEVGIWGAASGEDAFAALRAFLDHHLIFAE